MMRYVVKRLTTIRDADGERSIIDLKRLPEGARVVREEFVVVNRATGEKVAGPLVHRPNAEATARALERGG